MCMLVFQDKSLTTDVCINEGWFGHLRNWLFFLLLCDRKVLSLWQTTSLCLPVGLFTGLGKGRDDHCAGAIFSRSTGLVLVMKPGSWVLTQPFRIASVEVPVQSWGKQACSFQDMYHYEVRRGDSEATQSHSALTAAVDMPHLCAGTIWKWDYTFVWW